MHRLRTSTEMTIGRRATVLLSAAVVFLLALFVALPATVFGQVSDSGASDGVTTDIEICPTPTPSTSPFEVGDPDVEPLPEPSPSDDSCDDDSDDDTDDGTDDDGKDGDGKDGDGKNDSNKDNDGPGRDRSFGDDGGRSGDDGSGGEDHDGSGGGAEDNGGKDNKDETDLSSAPATKFTGTESIAGDFDTDKLQFIAAQLRARGVSEEKILDAVYPPFILAGPAAWTDTWGAPRYGPGPLVRTHEGQDVFCKYGDPVLATESGTIEFDDGGLGGRVARLYREDESYWYYAHLSDWNTKEFKNGDKVHPGDVIGYCGNSGNAITTPPHVHFGWYQKGGTNAQNPMDHLVDWLKEAEAHAEASFERLTGKRIDEIEETTSTRRFGDSFAPDISELSVSSESLLAAGSSPASGAFDLAETALRAALADGDATTDEVDEVSVDQIGAGAGPGPLTDLLDDGLVEEAASSD